MSIKVMSWVWESGPENGLDRMVLLALADHCDDAGHGFPSMIGLAEKACITERGARKVMRRLEADGWVKTAIGGGRGGKSRYQILMVNPERHSRNDEPGTLNPEPACRKPGTSVPETRNSGSPEPSVTIKEPSEEKNAREFDAIWAAYPRRVGKGSAEKAWIKARRSASFDAISEPLAMFVRSVRGTDPQFVPHLATWLNGRRWEDDPGHGVNRPRTAAEDIANLSRITAADDVASLFAGIPQLRIAR